MKVERGWIQKPFKEVKAVCRNQIKERRRVARNLIRNTSPNPYVANSTISGTDRGRRLPKRRGTLLANELYHEGEDRDHETPSVEDGSDDPSPVGDDKNVSEVAVISRVLSNPALYPHSFGLKALHGEVQDVRQNATRKLKEIKALGNHVASEMASNVFAEKSRVVIGPEEATLLVRRFLSLPKQPPSTLSAASSMGHSPFRIQPETPPRTQMSPIPAHRAKDGGVLSQNANHTTNPAVRGRKRPRGRPSLRGRSLAKGGSTPRPSTYIPTGIAVMLPDYRRKVPERLMTRYT